MGKGEVGPGFLLQSQVPKEGPGSCCAPMGGSSGQWESQGEVIKVLGIRWAALTAWLVRSGLCRIKTKWRGSLLWPWGEYGGSF